MVKRLSAISKLSRGDSKDPDTRTKLMKRLDALSFQAVRVLADGMHDPNPAIRLASAREVLDRRFGKPKQEASVDVRVSSMSEQHLAALRELAQAGLRSLPDQTQMIDVTPSVSEDVETP